MSNVIQNATSAVASLPALIIQRADPGLYNLLTNGIFQARLDFDRSKMTCRAIANRMADMAGGQAGWDQLAEGMALRDAVSRSEERRVGKEWVSTSRSRWSPDHQKKNERQDEMKVKHKNRTQLTTK